MRRAIVLTVLASVFLFAGPLPPIRSELLFDLDGNKIAENLDAIIASSAESQPVIVVLDEPSTESALGVLRAAIGNFELGASYSVINGFAATLTPDQIRRLAANPLVLQIEYDNPVYACMGTASNWFGSAKARADFGVDGNADGSAGYSKDDIVIVILDTGIHAGHYDLDGGKVIGWKDFVNNRTAPYDDNGHGTHCASIAAGAGDANSTYRGVAPGAALVGVKVLNSSGSGYTSTIISGVDWVVANKATYGINVLSISLGSSGSSNGLDALSLACNNAVAAGITTCVAAGNSGPARYTIGSPAAAESPVTVGAMSDCGEEGYFLAYFSSRGPTADNRVKPDVCGPGWYITAAKSGTVNGYTTMSGTSMSTPFVAGVAALTLDANPSLNPTQVKSLLQTTAQDWGPSGKDIDYGSGRCQAYEAVKTAGGYTGTGPAVPAHAYVADNLAAKGKTDIWQVNVNTTAHPVALTMVMPNWTSTQNFDLYLYNPSNKQVAKSAGRTRQEYIGYTPTVTGNYRVHVKSTAGSGLYFLDLSCANATSVTMVQNQSIDPELEQGAMSVPTELPANFLASALAAGRIGLSFDLARAEEVTVGIYDGAGRIVVGRRVAATAGRNRLELGSRMPAGVYFYRVFSSSLNENGKVTLVR